MTACAARLGCVELRRNASMEERRAGAALLRAFVHLVKRLQASQAELKAVLDGLPRSQRCTCRLPGHCQMLRCSGLASRMSWSAVAGAECH